MHAEAAVGACEVGGYKQWWIVFTRINREGGGRRGGRSRPRRVSEGMAVEVCCMLYRRFGPVRSFQSVISHAMLVFVAGLPSGAMKGCIPNASNYGIALPLWAIPFLVHAEYLVL